MPKALVKTSGSFQLVCQSSGQLVPFNRPVVVEMSVFFNARAGLGQLIVMENDLSDIATDALLVQCIEQEKGNVDKGVERFRLKIKPAEVLNVRTL